MAQGSSRFHRTQLHQRLIKKVSVPIPRDFRLFLETIVHTQPITQETK